MKKLLIVTLMAFLVFGIVGVSSAAKPTYNWNFALNSSEHSMVYQVAALFKKNVEKQSGGKIKVNLFPSGQLGKDKEIAEGVIAGNITGGCFNPATFSSYVPNAAIFDLFNTFEDRKHARKVFDGALNQALIDMFAKIDIKPLAFVEIGFRKLMSNKKVENIDDINGQKIRVMETPDQIAYWKAIGANPTPLDWGEVYMALQQGTIDANEQPEDFIRSAKLYEVQDYMIETSHLLQLGFLFMNKNLYNSLPDDIKKIVDASAKDTIEQGRATSDARLAKNRAFLQEQGMQFLPASPEMLAEMKKRAQSVNAGIRKKLGPELEAALDKALEEAK